MDNRNGTSRRARIARFLAPALAFALGVSSCALAQGSSDSLGRLKVPPQVMAGQCLTMVSPHYPQLAIKDQKPAVIIVQVEISRLGHVWPVRVLSGPPSLETEAMNAVRLWRYRPYMHDGTAVDVTTEIPVTFTPGKTGGIVTHPAG